MLLTLRSRTACECSLGPPELLTHDFAVWSQPENLTHSPFCSPEFYVIVGYDPSLLGHNRHNLVYPPPPSLPQKNSSLATCSIAQILTRSFSGLQVRTVVKSLKPKVLRGRGFGISLRGSRKIRVTPKSQKP